MLSLFYGTTLLASLLAITTLTFTHRVALYPGPSTVFCMPCLFSCTQQCKHYKIDTSAIMHNGWGAMACHWYNVNILLHSQFSLKYKDNTMGEGETLESLVRSKWDLYLTLQWCVEYHTYTVLVLGLCPANERWRYFVTTSLIGWVQT